MPAFAIGRDATDDDVSNPAVEFLHRDIDDNPVSDSETPNGRESALAQVPSSPGTLPKGWEATGFSAMRTYERIHSCRGKSYGRAEQSSIR